MIDLALLGAGGVALPDDMLSFIDLGPAALAQAARLLEQFRGTWPVGAALPQENVKLLAPIPRPRKNIFGIGLNYVEHVEESSRTLDTSADLPKQPVIFSKPPTTVIGRATRSSNARITQQLDWEVELAVIMGRRARAWPRPTRCPTCSAIA